MKIISVVNPKGGAGKTVTAVNISYALHNRGKKVLLIDADARGAVSVYLGLKNENTLFHLIKEQYEKLNVFDLKKYIIEKNGIDIIISDAELNKMDGYFIVENQDAQSQIDSIVNIHNLTKAVLKATDYIFAPSKSSAIDINGLADLLNMYDISRVINPKLEIRKIFLVQTKQNTIVYKETKDELMKYFSNNEFSEISVREDQNILNSMKQQKDIFSYRSYSNAAIDYKNLVDEFLEEEEENEY